MIPIWKSEYGQKMICFLLISEKRAAFFRRWRILVVDVVGFVIPYDVMLEVSDSIAEGYNQQSPSSPQAPSP